MKGTEIRRAFVQYFEKHGHTYVKSAPLVPRDKTLLFNIAGMVPFKPYFLGEVAPPFPRAVSSQKCIRTNDIDRVGETARHLTFFEMLGNFSFGDYFKRDAIRYGWEFLTREVGLPADKLFASVYLKDDEAYRLWGEVAGLPESRIIRLGKEHNFWEVGPTGPCGPCSEIIYDQGPSFSCGRPECAPGCDCDRYMEVWNLVFMEFNHAAGQMQPLPKKNIDTGMGLERLVAVIQNKKSNFETDLLYPIIEEVCRVAGCRYEGRAKVALNVIADHMRAIVFLMADAGKIRPSNDERGYVLRRLIRRAAVSIRRLGVTGASLHRLVPRVVEMFADPFEEVAREQAEVTKELLAEEERFAKTLDIGMERLSVLMSELKRSQQTVLPGPDAFALYDTYGFPLELTEEMLKEESMTADRAGFDREMQAQKERARAAFAAAHDGAEAIYMSVAESTVFVGYEKLTCDAKVVKICRGGKFVDEAGEGEEIEMLFDRTPLYADRGGQVGDHGKAASAGAEIAIADCFPVGKVYVHRGKVVRGKMRVGDAVTVEVDGTRRAAIQKNHTATHLLQAALRSVIGEHVHQAGSLVAPDRLRFDFTHGSGLGDAASTIETAINRWIQENLPVRTQEMTMADAQKTGAMMLFDEKYGDRVRVVKVGEGQSQELCGGTHCGSTGEIGLFKIVTDAALAAGVRRVEAVTGMGAVSYVQELARDVRTVERDLKMSLADAPAYIEKMQKERKDLEKKLKEARMKGGPAEDVASKAERAGDLTFIAAQVEDADMDTLRGMAERARDKINGPVFLATVSGDTIQMVMAVPKTMTDRFHAGKIIGAAAASVGGKGGGRPDFAQAGGRDVAKLQAAIDTARKFITG